MNLAGPMAHALTLGRRGLGRCWPNPAVGCVIVKDGRIVGRGWTQAGGRPHGETMALAQAGAAARGATAFVTLEPCAHVGVTPPCASALIEAGVARVVAALGDPDPRVSGGGFAMLRAAGVEVTEGVLRDEAARDHAGFLSRVTRGRPMVTLKLATSVDGRIATASGESRWITGPEARRAVHAMRMTHDAVLVGGGTARADDPMLDVRGMGEVEQPVRVVLSRRASIPRDGRLALSARWQPLWLLHGTTQVPPERMRAWHALGARTIGVPVGRAGEMDPSAALRALGEAGLTRVLCEGGGALAASLLQAGLVDRLVVFGAGLALGAEGRPSLGALSFDRLADAPRFTLERVAPVGGDTMQVWAVSAP
ncbi:bifunctional diaminohydroxyphosphoribosylaminopyrimidine deaminase/5-amino-6-(5-phosphoribosylamino)uracil reductase RibD [Oceaniglobus roseus]|uniref:bifunctional diaminohydroxyphosphoribosylaminopyrimidine deaminase/5-amino-6-(5-phosphoribosylamino)uracil reductase RibD n=1 Tax=Oceaniglobus roseus TaxID=1737570 RepID=UPI001FE9E79D|nr:bifunctional diaminohydroxyphosphoribosylaminopyrimidine deaminase/5-amino-6-(5-phosphoribosylamino)uracil reductase RibD [Kandeliimicrobium roseum]